MNVSIERYALHIQNCYNFEWSSLLCRTIFLASSVVELSIEWSVVSVRERSFCLKRTVSIERRTVSLKEVTHMSNVSIEWWTCSDREAYCLTRMTKQQWYPPCVMCVKVLVIERSRCDSRKEGVIFRIQFEVLKNAIATLVRQKRLKTSWKSAWTVLASNWIWNASLER